MATISGGDKLERALLEMARQVSKPATLRVGFLENSSYPDGKKVALIAAFQEFGTARIPTRPFMRNMIAEKSPGWPAAVAANLKANDYDATRALHDVGEAIKGQLQQAIRDFVGTPLSPATIARKGHGKELIDTGHLLASVDFEVNNG
jgi:hypothetical protein